VPTVHARHIIAQGPKPDNRGAETSRKAALATRNLSGIADFGAVSEFVRDKRRHNGNSGCQRHAREAARVNRRSA
jgi:hypothetical protein